VLLQGQDAISLLTFDQIETQILDSLAVQDEALDWGDMNIDLLYSTLMRNDSIAIVGFKPPEIANDREAINTNQFESLEWKTARKELMSFIKSESDKLEINLNYDQLFGENSSTSRPYLYAKIVSKNILEKLRSKAYIRYVEPANYYLFESNNRSGEGCDDYSIVLDPADFSAISPAAIASWTQAEHMIDLAWTKSNKGQGTWIAVMDSGISPNNPKFNAEFNEGESTGRVIERNGFYAPNGTPDGWQDQCGHGTAMAGLAMGTRGFDNTPAGVAYQANLISYRVTNDVRINNSDEIDGLHDALYHAGDDSRIDIISISLGDIFSHGPVEDGIVYAHDQGKLIFAAAGTSTSFTNWFGVIAPANMPEAIAVTGVIEGTNFEKCDICHSGNEVEFSVFMERSASGNKAVTLANDNAANNNYKGYVGGSSSSTAIMAGIAGLIKSNNPNFTKDQIINRLIQSASNYPVKDSDFGWGTIDVCAAVDSTLSLPCSSTIGNTVMMEITSISFPPVGDGFGDPELVLKIGGKSYYFNVPSTGASSNPNAFIDPTVCDNIPIIIDLGTTVCGTSSIDITVETHEDDGTSSECDFGSGDDDQVITTETVNFSSNAFSQATPNGDWIFTYSLSCAPTLIAGLGSNLPLCSGEVAVFTATPSGESNYNFFKDMNLNGQLDAGESLQNGNLENFSSMNLIQNDVIGIEVADVNGCTSYSYTTVQIINFTNLNALTGTELSIADYETNDTIQSTQLIKPSATVDYDAAKQICLGPGFEVESGAVFSAFIDGCNGGLGGENSKPKDSAQ